MIRFIFVGYSIFFAIVLLILLIHIQYKRGEAEIFFNRFLKVKHKGVEYLRDSLRNFSYGFQRKLFFKFHVFNSKECEEYKEHQLLKFLEFPIQMYSENMIARDIIETTLYEWKKLFDEINDINT